MIIGLSGNNLKVYHTEVLPIAEGKGFYIPNLKAITQRKYSLQKLIITPLLENLFFLIEPFSNQKMLNQNCFNF